MKVVLLGAIFPDQREEVIFGMMKEGSLANRTKYDSWKVMEMDGWEERERERGRQRERETERGNPRN